MAMMQIEFRFRDANNRIDLKCGRTSVLGTWLTVSHISGPALINTIQACRNQRARVEGPDHVQQFAQLSAVIAPWYNDAMANLDDVVGTTTDQLPVERGNFHLRARSKLQVHPLTFVRQEALAHRSHDEGNELAAQRGPPALMEEAYDQSVSVISPVIEGEELPADRTEEYIKEARDRLRADMRFSRTSAAITPQIFTDVLRDREEAEYRRYSTVRVEETGPELPASSSTPSTAPHSFAPAYPPARTATGPYAMASSRQGDEE
ncbi:UBI1 [Symbiodinium sp. KB8]|nr:UBI1 [Symbiodinium sp. KB8]